METVGRGIPKSVGTLIMEYRIPGSKDLIEVYRPKQHYEEHPVTFLRYNILGHKGWKEGKTATIAGKAVVYPSGVKYEKERHFMTLGGVRRYVERTYGCMPL